MAGYFVGFFNGGTQPRPVLPYYKKVKEIGSDYYQGPYRRISKGSFGETYTETRTGLAKTLGFSISDNALGLTTSILQAADDKAAAKLLENIKAQRVNLAQIWAERQQTLRLIGETALKIANAIRHLKHGGFADAARALGAGKPSRTARRRVARDPGRARKTSDFVSRSWLELQYGWKPLLQDVYGAAQALAERGIATHLTRVKSSSTVRLQGRNPGVPMAPGNLLYGYGDISYVKTIRYGCAFYTDTGKELVALGLTNPLTIAWELTPYSFVADWFIPIGDWINTLDATVGCHFYDGYRNEKIEIHRHSYTTSDGYASEYFTSRNFSKEIIFERSRLINFPSSRLPSFKNPLSLGHALNGLSLLTQSVVKHR